MIENITLFITGISVTYIYIYNKRTIYLPLLLKYISIFYIITIFSDNILFKTILHTNKPLFYFFPVYSTIEIILPKPVLLLNFIILIVIIIDYYFKFYEGIEWLILFHSCHVFTSILYTVLDFFVYLLVQLFKNKQYESLCLRRSLRLANKPKINYKL